MKNTVKIGKTTWAVGMTWRSYSDRPTLSELREDADDLRANLAAVRVSPQVRQAGFMASEPGDKRPSGVFSLAAAIADAREQPWLGIYRIGDNRWWYIAVREGQAVLPDGDVVGDEDTILRARANHESYADWNYVKGDTTHLRALIEEQGKNLRLVPIKSLKPVSLFLPAVGAAAALTCVSGGGMWWHNYEAAKQQARAAAAAAAEMRRGQQEAAISPLLKTPMPAAWLSSCVGEILAQQITVEAWTLGHAACTDSAAILTWERQDGATVAERPSGTVDRSGDTITQTIGFPASPNGSDNAQGLPASNIALQALLQPIGVSPQISEPVQPQPLPGATAAVPPPGLPPDPEETVTITLPVTPTLIHFDQIPGLRLDTLSINDDGDWILTGEIYGR